MIETLIELGKNQRFKSQDIIDEKKEFIKAVIISQDTIQSCSVKK